MIDLTDSQLELIKATRRLSELVKIQREQAGFDEYMRGLANGLILADSLIHDYEPDYVSPPQSFTAGLINRARHSRTKCMRCPKPPAVDVIWADERGRAWFCKACFNKWKSKGREIVRQKKVYGEVGKKYSDTVQRK